jgi:uncharacterized protein YutE (UPF0331/DUF86 family)
MFNSFKKKPARSADPIQKVYQRLLPYQEKYKLFGLNVDYKSIAPESLVRSLYGLSNDVQTTAHLVRVLQQRQFAEGILDRVDVEAVRSSMGRDAAKRDADEHYQSIKEFCDSIIDLVDLGEITRDQPVGRFLDENISAIMVAGSIYQMRFS